MMRVGDSNPGIVMAGRFSSEATKMVDWSGEGKVRFYCDLWMNFIVDPEIDPCLSLDRLTQECPQIDWNHGHSGEQLPKEVVNKLDELWKEYKEDNPSLFNRIGKRLDLAIEPEAAEKIENFGVYREMCSWSDTIDTLSDGYTHDCANLSFNIDYYNGATSLSVYFMGGHQLNITCRGLKRIKCNLESGYTAFDDSHISAEYTDLLHLNTNGIDIICDHIRFDSITKYEPDDIPCSI